MKRSLYQTSNSMITNWHPTNLPYPIDLETKTILKKLTGAHRALAELKGIALSIPKQEILINTLAQDGLLIKHKLGKSNYYINTQLVELLFAID